MTNLVISDVAEGLRLLSGKELLFVSSRVVDFSVFHLGRTSDNGLLARVDLEITDSVASTEEVKTDRISSLTMVKSDLDASSAQAGSLERIFVNFSCDTMLNLGNFLKVGSFSVRRKARNNPVNVFRSSSARFIIAS